MIPAAFLASLAQFSDPVFRGVVLKGIGLTLALLAALFAVVFFGVSWALPDTLTLPWIGEVTFVDSLASWGAVILMFVLSIFLMVPVASAFTGLFLDDVADAVEARHHPHLSPAPRIGFSDNLRETFKFLGVMLFANLAALVLYFTPLAPFVFYGLNGFLLSREYFRMIAVRRMGRTEAGRLYRRNFLTIWAAGVMMAVPLTVPILSLVIPVLGAATFTHIYHGVART